jgi:hypothetical protein
VRSVAWGGLRWFFYECLLILHPGHRPLAAGHRIESQHD